MEAFGLKSEGEMGEFRNILKLIKSDLLIESILSQFDRISAKTRSWTMQFILIYHLDNKKIMDNLFHLISTCKVSKVISLHDTKSREFYGPEIARYWYELLKVLQVSKKTSDVISKQEYSYISTAIYLCLPFNSIKTLSDFVNTFAMA